MVSAKYAAIMKIILLIGLIIVVGATKPANFLHIPSEKPYTGALKTILFVGNSLTYTNDLPKMVVAFGKESGVEIKTTILAYPNYALEDHWNDGQVQKLIAKNKYDFVVVQQGPSSQIDGRQMLLDYGAKLKTLCDNTNTQLAFFMVWPAFSNIQTFDGVIQNYTDAALTTNSLLCPVGELWKKHFQDTGDYSFYGPDMFHPSEIGSKNAAKIIFETLFK
ncbi:MAG: hypothetical protein WAT88_18845 [Saprospiraceae bacterium]